MKYLKEFKATEIDRWKKFADFGDEGISTDKKAEEIIIVGGFPEDVIKGGDDQKPMTDEEIDNLYSAMVDDVKNNEEGEDKDDEQIDPDLRKESKIFNFESFDRTMGIYENVDDKSLIDAIEGLEDADIGWSNDPNKGLSIAFDWDNVDEDLLLKQILNLIKKVNPKADLVKKKQSLLDNKSNILANFNSKLYSASQRSFSASRGLKDYFIDNLETFK